MPWCSGGTSTMEKPWFDEATWAQCSTCCCTSCTSTTGGNSKSGWLQGFWQRAGWQRVPLAGCWGWMALVSACHLDDLRFWHLGHIDSLWFVHMWSKNHPRLRNCVLGISTSWCCWWPCGSLVRWRPCRRSWTGWLLSGQSYSQWSSWCNIFPKQELRPSLNRVMCPAGFSSERDKEKEWWKKVWK